jgi:Putative peptidoglycan binding domain
MECSKEFVEEIFKLAFLVHADDLILYGQLWLKSELNESESDQMAALYTKSETDSLLDFVITLYDHILSERVGLTSTESVKSYEDQQAWLREHLGQVLLEQSQSNSTQEFLKEVGFYQGPLDGVWGQRSRAAALKYRKKVQRLLQQRGLYGGEIDGELGNQSVIAVQEFQKSHNLKKDGVPSPKTFSELQRST